MLELLSPAGSAEAVIAAVQSGADTVYMGSGATDGGRSGQGFSAEELTQCLRYCRVRGCKAVVLLNELVTDDDLDRTAERAVFAARQGADALLVQDLGLAAVLRRLLPDTPLWGDVRLNIHNLDGARAAAAMGLRRIILAPELHKTEIEAIASKVPVETAVYVHGPLCFARMGQCYLSAMGDDRSSDSVLRCAEPCRRKFSLGGRMDEYPLSMSDVCLIDRLDELSSAGVTCAVIGGRGRRPEYVAYVTNLYRRAIRDGALPTQEERDRLEEFFAPCGITEGWYAGESGPALLGVPKEPPRTLERACTEIRKGYTDGELRRVPVTFYAVLKQGRPALFAAEDTRGHRAAYEGYAPIDLGRQGITAARVQEVMYRTGGTPYNCVGIHCAIDPHMDYADEALEQARRALLSQITDQNREPPSVTVAARPELPAPIIRSGPPKFIVQVSRADQLTPELAGTEPDLLYAPAEVLAAGPDGLDAFRGRGTVIAAVLPNIVTDDEAPVLRELLATLRGMGVREAVAGSLGVIPAIAEAGLTPRGDFGLNLSNSWAIRRMHRAGLKSVTASFQLSMQQIRRLTGFADVEMIVYGRVPVMVTDACLIRNSSGRCSCSTPTSMSDLFGNVYPVEKEFGCRNVVYDAKKIFLADRADVYEKAGLWGIRLMFTTESPRECADVAKRYRGLNRYEPNNTSRGLYPKGVL